MRKRKITWVLVGDAGHARLFRAEGRDGWVLVWEHDHPAGRAHPTVRVHQDDAEGHSHNETIRHDGPATGESPHSLAEHRFAHQIADLIDEGRRHGLFDELVLVAPPHFLGIIRGALTADATRMVRASLAKDLSRLDTREIRGRLSAEGLAK